MDSDKIYKELGKTIRRYRKGRRQTQEQLASHIGISRASLANIEAGRQQVLVHHLFAIANALKIDSPADLIATSSPKKRDADSMDELPLKKEGLSERQQWDVLSLMADEDEHSDDNVGEDK